MKLRTGLILSALIAGLWSCNKDANAPADNTPSTSLNVVNTITTDTLNFYLNGTRQNSVSSIYTGGATGYLSVKSGSQSYQFKKYGRSEVLFTKTLVLDTIPVKSTIRTDTIKNATTGAVTTITKKLKGYSFFVTSEDVSKAFLLKDTLKLNSDSATVRFVHTADGVGAVDVNIGGASFTNVSYGNATQFKTALIGSNRVVTVSLTGSTVAKATQRFLLSSSTAYTFYIRGVPDGTGKSVFTVGAAQGN
ncbi:DUF4397 domain-containing protein [Mucilaginibacter agri]|uniref:DUF4397 domain-containing protein n=1 Tax=Mucilaginibacter agri TaxID=2695265 RepID=A0A966DUX8_9SPHI|nr:DUF4397 domain-containing protein [Mucilaginibacter agri]NCD70897.1 hypothetical protein [Mucilaginibacter agri]